MIKKDINMFIDKKKNKKAYVLANIAMFFASIFVVMIMPVFGGFWPIVTHLPFMFIALTGMKNALTVNSVKQAGDYDPEAESDYRPE